MWSYNYSTTLMHSGIKGQKWGIRRFQNEDRTWTADGKKRYGSSNNEKKRYSSSNNENKTNNYNSNNSEKRIQLTDKQKKILKIGAIAAGTALAAYGTYKVSKFVKNKNLNVNNDQMKYINNNISNIQSHIDPTPSIRNSAKYQHALNATIKSRESSIKGDRIIYGDKTKRNAVKEAKAFVDNSQIYKAHRGGMFGDNIPNKNNVSSSISKGYDYTEMLKNNSNLLNESIKRLTK